MPHTDTKRRVGAALAAAFACSSAYANSVANAEDDTQGLPVAEEVTVTAVGTAADVPSGLASDVISWQDAVGSPSDFQDLITRVPGIGATGQNGSFETFSIRGSNSNSILIVVGGTPVTAQRRAGVPVAFVEPSLLGEINVTRGPATVHFGPGAVGGAISVEPRWFDGGSVIGSYASAGDEAALTAGFGSESFSIGVARHRAGDSESANGTPLNTSVERDSATLQYRVAIGEFDVDALLMPSKTEDIGKSNSRFPTRDTTYPEDKHVLGRLRLHHASGVEASLHAHDQSLITYNQRPGTADTFAFVESRDIGGTVQQTIDAGAFTHNIGIEYLGRRDVNGFDARETFSNRTFSLRDGRENGWSVFAISDWQASPEWAFELGARFSRLDQEQANVDSDDSDAGFTSAAIWTPTDSSRWTLNLASGYRFATLEERYFTGITPQGEIRGTPDLSSESSLGIDLGYAHRVGDWESQIHLWRTDVSDLIQLFEVEPGLNGFTNVGDAQLHGAEVSLSWAASDNLNLRATGAVVRSKDERTGDPLYGAPPVSASLDARYNFARFTLGGYYSHRWRMKRPGFEEVERDAVDVLDADLTFHASPAWDVQLFVRNAFNENYVATADELSALAQERSVGLNIVWNAR